MPKVFAAWDREASGVLAIAVLALIATTSVLALGLPPAKPPDQLTAAERAGAVTAPLRACNSDDSVVDSTTRVGGSRDAAEAEQARAQDHGGSLE